MVEGSLISSSFTVPVLDQYHYEYSETKLLYCSVTTLGSFETHSINGQCNKGHKGNLSRERLGVHENFMCKKQRVEDS